MVIRMPPACRTGSGEPLGVPPWTAYLNGQYDFPLGAALDGYARADYSYSSHDRTPLYTQSPLVDPAIPRPPATSELDLRFGATFNGWDASLFVDNAFGCARCAGVFGYAQYAAVGPQVGA
jgi:iron complex outermembrane recepter protein